MQREEKEKLVGELHQKMDRAVIAVLAAFDKLNAEDAIGLRARLRAGRVEYRVVKNTLARRAAQGTPLEKVSQQFEGPTALVMGYADPIGPAKLLAEALKELGGKLSVKAAVVEGSATDARGVEQLARMPGLPELRGMLVGMIAGPASKLVRLLSTPAQQLARAVGERQKALGGPA